MSVLKAHSSLCYLLLYLPTLNKAYCTVLYCIVLYYILNCSSYLKYRLCVSLRFKLSWHDSTANIKYGIIDALSLWYKYNVIAYTVVIHERLDTRVETRCSGGFSICLASRSRHFSYSEIEFYFRVLVKFSSVFGRMGVTTQRIADRKQVVWRIVYHNLV